MNVLITGVTGMIGSSFAKAGHAKNWNVFGVARNSSSSRLFAEPDPTIVRCDILERDALASVFRKVEPEIVVHMAAQAFNGVSWNAEYSTHQTNETGTLNVLHCVKTLAPSAKLLLACSSAEYGLVTPEDCPLQEDRPLRPVSPYGVSKVSVECLGYQYASNFDLKVYLPRLFIHVGTGHPPATAIQNFARQLALIAKGRQEPIIRVGNLETARDFIDVRDGVAGMMCLLEKGPAKTPVNICTGQAHKISDILKMLIEISELSVDVVFDEALGRPSDEQILLGDNSRLKELGWKQEFTIRETLQAVYRDWLGRIESGASSRKQAA